MTFMKRKLMFTYTPTWYQPHNLPPPQKKKKIKFTFSHTNQEIKGCDIDHKEELNTFITCVFDRETLLQCVNSYND